MTITEALEALKAGKRIRRSCWVGGQDACFVSARGGVCVTPTDLLADDWEVAPEMEPLPQVGFAEALAAMLEGKKVRRAAWSSFRGGRELELLKGFPDMLMMSVPGENGKGSFTPDTCDILATDWEILP